jgi:hypothetical protein
MAKQPSFFSLPKDGVVDVSKAIDNVHSLDPSNGEI